MRGPDHENRLLREIAAHVLPGSGWPVVEPTESGFSTPVYRIARGGTTFYLRLAEGPEASLAPEVLAHDLLCARGVRVPEVVHFEPFHQQLQRSVMVTTAIPGRSLAADYQGIDVGPVLVAAGRDLAAINGVDVAGFGFIRRDQPGAPRLEAEAPTVRAFALGDVEGFGIGIFERFFEKVVDLYQDAGLVWGRELYGDATRVRADADTDSPVPRFYADARAHVADIFADSSGPTDESPVRFEDGLLRFPAHTGAPMVRSRLLRRRAGTC